MLFSLFKIIIFLQIKVVSLALPTPNLEDEFPTSDKVTQFYPHALGSLSAAF
jgi:hypothetical protein